MHGDVFLSDHEPWPVDQPGAIEADALARVPVQDLVIKTADRQPILLAHKKGKHVAALLARQMHQPVGLGRGLLLRGLQKKVLVTAPAQWPQLVPFTTILFMVFLLF